MLESGWAIRPASGEHQMRVFIPVEDESVDPSCGRLIPYRFGVPCAHALREPSRAIGSPVRASVDARPAVLSPCGSGVGLEEGIVEVRSVILPQEFDAGVSGPPFRIGSGAVRMRAPGRVEKAKEAVFDRGSDAGC